MIEVRLDGCISGSGLDITFNRRDMRSEFGYTMLNEIACHPFEKYIVRRS